MSKLLAAAQASGGGIVVLCMIIALICIAPMIFLWAGNSLMAAAGMAYYIPHTLWNYVYTIFFVGILRGGK